MVMIELQNPRLPKINQIHFRDKTDCEDVFYMPLYFIATYNNTMLKSRSFPSVPFPITANEVGMRKNNDTQIFSN